MKVYRSPVFWRRSSKYDNNRIILIPVSNRSENISVVQVDNNRNILIKLQCSQNTNKHRLYGWDSIQWGRGIGRAQCMDETQYSEVGGIGRAQCMDETQYSEVEGIGRAQCMDETQYSEVRYRSGPVYGWDSIQWGRGYRSGPVYGWDSIQWGKV